jgi:GSCFA family
MNFRTTLPFEKSNDTISHLSPLLCVGSCFAENIGQKLENSKFSTFINPFGISYNPVSIAECLSQLIENQLFTKENIFQQGEFWHSFSHHGHFSKMSSEETLTGINAQLLAARVFFKTTKKIIITLGSANVFVHQKTGKIVANCHKVPQQAFEKRRLHLEEITSSLENVLTSLKIQNQELEVILSVSPIRHLREGIVENQRSKATLILASEALCKRLDFVRYFPAYEIMMDDLRDYRFYESDMTHSTSQAVDYIWDFFQKTYFSEKTQLLTQRIESIVTASLHRPFHVQSADYQNFIKNTLSKIDTLKSEFPYLDFDKEENILTAFKIH